MLHTISYPITDDPPDEQGGCSKHSEHPNLSQKDPSFGKLGHVVNLCIFLDILVLSNLDLGQISFNLVKNMFETQQLAFLATSIAFYHIFTRAYAEIKILR